MTQRAQPLAIVSIGALFPGAPTTDAFWRDLLEGRDRLTEVPKTHWLSADYFAPKPGTPDKVYATKGGFLSEVDFSPVEFGLPPNTLPAIDTAQLLSLLVAKRVLVEATKGRYETMDRSRISVILGVASATELVAHMSGRLQLPVVERAMRAGGLSEPDVSRIMRALESCYVPWQENTFPGMLGNVVAGRISNRFDLGGTNTVLDAACAGSLAAIAMAAGELSLGIADMVITGGVDTLNDILMFMCFAQTGALSITGDCRPFSNEADGTMLGEGIGLFALKRLSDAERDKDTIYAVLRGIGTSSDGKAMSIYAPSAKGQAKALRRAYENAGVSPSAIELIEAHGTGTKAGDATELEALLQVYEGVSPERCAIGSVKGQIGHTKAAAGAAGLAKVALALHHKVLPPTIKVKAPAPTLAERKTPFYVNTAARPWIANPSQPRRAAVSALGFGGTNFHVIVEEYQGEAPRPLRLRALPAEMVALCAKDAKALADLCRLEAEKCKAPGALVHLARRSQSAFEASAPIRLALVAANEEELVSLLQASATFLLERRGNPPRGVYIGEGEAAGPIAFVFPGQGSQYLDMGADLAIHFDTAREVWDQAASLEEFLEERLQSRVFPVPVFSEEARTQQEAQLTQTDWAQPALTTTSLSMLRLLRLLGLRPTCVAGHSLGEVTALAASGALSSLDAIRVARLRGQRMAEASRTTEGAMLAVASDWATVEKLLGAWGLPLSLANHNAPQQVVLSGSKAAILDAEGRLSKERIAARRLPVATAFHSPIVAGACVPFQDTLQRVSFGDFEVPAYSNVTAAPYPKEKRQIQEQLASAVAKPVRFVEMIQAMYQDGARTFIEVGPEAVLTKLIGRCLTGKPHLAVSLDQPGKNGVVSFFHALARLCASGIPMQLEALWREQALPEDPAQKAPSKLTIKISGANFGKPYPQKADELMSKAKPTDQPQESTDARPSAPSTQLMQPPSKAPAPMPVKAEIPSVSAPAVLPRRPSDGSVLSALRELQAPIIAAQMEYERLMAESHSAFLRTIETSYAMISPNALPVRVAPQLAPATNGHAYQAPPPSLEVFQPAPVAIAAPAPIAPVPVPAPVPVAPAPVPAPSAPKASPPAAPPKVEVKALMPQVLGIVAEKTGYPVEMIQPTMDLESELGIDSIKRVEILAAMRDRVPGLPEAEPSKMSKLRTLAEIVRFFEPPGGEGQPQSTATPEAGSSEQPKKKILTTTDNAPQKASEVLRFVVRPKTLPAVGLSAPGLFGGGLFSILPDDHGVAEIVRDLLIAKGIQAEVATQLPKEARGVLYLGGLRSLQQTEDALSINREAFEIAVSFAQRPHKERGLFVTVQDTGGDVGLSGRSGARAYLAGLSGLTKTAAQEWPEVCARAIDIEQGERGSDAIAEAIVAELLYGGSEREVGLRKDGERSVLETVPAAPTLGQALPKGAVIVATGGARGVTTECLLALAKEVTPRLLLLGRTKLTEEPEHLRAIEGDAALKRAVLAAHKGPGALTPRELARQVEQITTAREIRQNLARFQALGVEARYESVDVRDTALLEALLQDVRQKWGPIQALVHGAGVLSDALLEKRTGATQFDNVFDTKVRGLSALLSATKDDPLSWICLFSSVAARDGNAGQADYAMANEVLNKVAAAETYSRKNCRVTSLGWGPWEGGMVTPALAQHFTARGVGLIALDAGAKAFVQESQAQGDIEVLLGGAGLSSQRHPWRAEVQVSQKSLPHLVDHQVQGAVVLPIVLSVDWFARLFAQALRAKMPLTLGEVRVLRGLVLPDFAQKEERLDISLQPDNQLGLRDATGALRVSARLVLNAQLPAPVSASKEEGVALSGSLYGAGRLFHGPAFQLIKEVASLSSEGAQASVRGVLDAGWAGEYPLCDPAMLDAGLQLALLSGLCGGMGQTLPLVMEQVILHRPPVAGPISCTLQTKSRSKERARYDILFTDPKKEALAQLVGVEMYAVPGGTNGTSL